MKHWAIFLVFLCAVVGSGMLIGIYHPPGEWYVQLNKPSFTPPNYLFAPVWTILYICIAIVGYRVYRQRHQNKLFILWCVQMLLNFSWSPLFFGLHWLGLAWLVLTLTVLTIFIFIGYGWSKDRFSVYLFIPYCLWVSFANVLNATIYLFN